MQKQRDTSATFGFWSHGLCVGWVRHGAWHAAGFLFILVDTTFRNNGIEADTSVVGQPDVCKVVCGPRNEVYFDAHGGGGGGGEERSIDFCHACASSTHVRCCTVSAPAPPSCATACPSAHGKTACSWTRLRTALLEPEK